MSSVNHIFANHFIESHFQHMSREHKGKLTLDALLIMPVQRIPRYELLIKVRSIFLISSKICFIMQEDFWNFQFIFFPQWQSWDKPESAVLNIFHISWGSNVLCNNATISFQSYLAFEVCVKSDSES